MLENEKNKLFLTIETAVFYDFFNLPNNTLIGILIFKKNCNLYYSLSFLLFLYNVLNISVNNIGITEYPALSNL